MARLGKTQADIAKVLGITRQAVSRRLVGATVFRIDEIEKIAALLNVSVADLVGGPEREEASA